LDLKGSAATDRDRADASTALRRLDTATRHVWERKGTHNGFLLATSETLEGLAIAMRRYAWDEIVEVIRWSAERVAARKLAPAMFATTFRGAAFDCRYADWQRHVRWEAQRAVAAAHAEPEPSPPPESATGGDYRAMLESVLGEVAASACVAASVGGES